MPTKVFTVMGGVCPFGRGFERDSPRCRQCDDYIRAGTGTFFWCNHPNEQESTKSYAQKSPEIMREALEIAQKAAKSARNPTKIAQKSPKIAQERRKQGRPAGKVKKKPVKTRKSKKG